MKNNHKQQRSFAHKIRLLTKVLINVSSLRPKKSQFLWAKNPILFPFKLDSFIKLSPRPIAFASDFIPIFGISEEPDYPSESIGNF